ncbi:hypothetical protein KIW84_030304 [Lathyrus oleraceus]|uniref:Uncharacterized protein n=1 Tax=Pisum sativum TaxID=3888 RepID=A0A9D4XMI1_PEA|nr:hypothetical protein KIW84_030304 [Pisum sativum]
MVEVAENKSTTGSGFQRGSSEFRAEDVQPNFHSGGFIHGNEQHLVAVIEGDKDEDCTNFVTHVKACNNWTVVNVPVEEESDEDVSHELTRLLEHEEKSIQPFEEQIELVNLGFEDDVKEVKMCLPGLDSEIVEHRLSLKPKCKSVKQKLRRTHPDIAVKIKEEVQKQIDVGFLVTAEYP